MTGELTEVWVCTDCYFAHHFGATRVEREATDIEADAYFAGHARYRRELAGITIVETPEGLEAVEWFAGESDTRCEGGEPLRLLDGHLFDDTDSETGDGIDEFSWRHCQGCGSDLGGQRYRLSMEAT